MSTREITAVELAGQTLDGIWTLDHQPLQAESSGQAWVFGALDERTDVRVVVKIFKPERAVDYDREIQALERLGRAHVEHTAAIRGHGTVRTSGSVLPFLVLDFVEGCPLSQLLSTGIFSFGERLEILVQVAEGLAELHDAGVIHRDVKPGNIIVHFVDTDSSRASDYLKAKLIDLGISTVLSAGATSHRTQVKGTMPYMAPEQAQGIGAISYATDLYAFALVARDMLECEVRDVPLTPEQARTDLDEVFRGRGRRYASRLRDLLQTFLQADPAQRLTSGRELATDLRDVLGRARDASVGFPGRRALRNWRASILAGSQARLGDVVRSLHAVAEWCLRFCGSVLLACLPDSAREEARVRIAAGDAWAEVVNRALRGVSLDHPAARAAHEFWQTEVKQDGTLLADDPEPGATRFPKPLLVAALEEVALNCPPMHYWAWTRSLLGRMAHSALFTEFTLGRIDPDDHARLLVRHDRESCLPWRRMIGDRISAREPLLVQVNSLGRANLDVPPVRLAPFALLTDDNADLCFLEPGGLSFASPFTAGAVASPHDARYQMHQVVTAVSTRPTPPPAVGVRATLPDCARPVMALTVSAWTFLLTETDEWIGVRGNDEHHPPLTRLPGSAQAVIDVRGELVVAQYKPVVARLHEGDWEYLPRDASVLAMASTSRGVLVGDAAGKIAFLDNGELLDLGEAVIEICALEHGLVALGAAGSLVDIPWSPADNLALRRIDTSALGRAVGLFHIQNEHRAGVYGVDRVGILDASRGEIIHISSRLGGGIRAVASFGCYPAPLAVLTDIGELWLLNADLADAGQVWLPGEAAEIAGIRTGADGRLLVWTADGDLYSVGKGRGVLKLASTDVVLAYSVPGEAGATVVVRWTEGAGARVESLITKSTKGQR